VSLRRSPRVFRVGPPADSRRLRAVPDQRDRPPLPTPAPARTRAISLATDEQKAKVAGLACVALGEGPCSGPIDPMHLIDRSLAPSMGDDIRAVVPCCRRHHDLYDGHQLDLSPFLEPRWRTEVAWAIEAVGLFRALQRITGRDWAPIGGLSA
jgi:hypothetical protein